VRKALLNPRAAKLRARELEEYELLVERRLATLVPVREPLVLISQIQRSGGTLLSQLFDAHPECHAHPYELKIGPRKSEWPRIDVFDDPTSWFDLLYERYVQRLFRNGYSKYSSALVDELPPHLQPERFPFLFLRRLQQRIFFELVDEESPQTPRDVLDAYMTSYFNAWLDNNNLYAVPKRIVTGFTPRLMMDAENVELFFDDYPDGTLLTMVRSPSSWYASARRHYPAAYEELDVAMELWTTSTRASIEARRARPDRVQVVLYEDLVLRTEEVMSRLAGRLGIELLPTLLEPTFNGFPIRADSAFRVPEFGVIRDGIERGKEMLPAEVVRTIEQRSGDLYAEAGELAA
jgi:hypothetical protein